MTTTPLLRLEDIVFSYPGSKTPILNGIDLTLPPRMRLGLIGPNGCGKTTLFHLIMGLHKPTAGTLFFKEEAVTHTLDYRNLRRAVNLLFQDADDQLFCPTVIEDVAFGPLNLGHAPDKAREIAYETLASLGLGHLDSRITYQLSGGEKKLVALATILAMRPEALFLDEPTNNLDPDTREKLLTIIAGLDPAFIIISHDYDFLAASCTDLATMDHGQLSLGETSQLHTHHHIHPHGALPHKHGDS